MTKKDSKLTPILTYADYPKALVRVFMEVFRTRLPTPSGGDLETFVRYFLASMSLDITEKYNVIRQVHLLDQRRCAALLQVWKMETKKFEKLARTHWSDVVHLQALTWLTNCLLADYLEVSWGPEQERVALQKMVRRKYKKKRLQAKLRLGILSSGQVMARYVFEPALNSLDAHEERSNTRETSPQGKRAAIPG